MQIVYSRVSTATQSLLRQRHILTEAGLLVRTEGIAEGFRPADGVRLFEDPATTSKIPVLERPAFTKVAAAHPHSPAQTSKTSGRPTPNKAPRSPPSPAPTASAAPPSGPHSRT